jgi:hypothetical protein
MLQKNVKIGETYLTRIGGELRRVRVDQLVTRTSFGYRGGEKQITRFRVTELKTGKELPKLRSSSSLREITKPTSGVARVRFEPDSQLRCRHCGRTWPLFDLPPKVQQDKRDAHERGCAKNPEVTDVRVSREGGSLFVFDILSTDAAAWVAENVAEPKSWLGTTALIVEHRYAKLLADGLREAGFIVR